MIKHSLDIKEPFECEAGGVIENLHLVYHTSFERYTPGDKVIWICHALTANSDVQDWWPELVGPGLFIDTEKYFVICVNTLCSPYGSSGPSFIDPKSGRPYYFNFPQTTIRDLVKTFTLVRKKLGIEKIDLLIGSSIGGFQAIEWAIMEPEVITKAAFIATSPRMSPWLGAGVETQRMAIEADATFRQCKSLNGGSHGLKCARAQALISYRCYNGYALTQSEPHDETLFAGKVASYERYQGEKLVKRGFDAYSYWYICNMLDSNNAGRGRAGIKRALSSIKAQVVAACIDTDSIFPPQEFEQWVHFIPCVETRRIKSNFGHDGFLLETQQVKETLRAVLP